MSEVLPGHPEVAGPVEVYRANDYGVTARFSVASGPLAGKGVVLKANFLPTTFTATMPYELLNRCYAGDTPKLLAAVDEPGRRWMLFQVFHGQSVRAAGTLEAICSMAETMAHIQARIAALPRSEKARLPRLDVLEIPRMFVDVLSHVRETYAPLWAADASDMTSEKAIPQGFGERLERFVPRIAEWAKVLSAAGWPDSLDHVDLHANNGVLQPDGRVLIFDWEEAVLGCPFFSIDKLLADAEETASPLHSAEREAMVRRAYLDALPWKTREERGRALEVALCLGPIRYAWEDARFAEAVGWPVAAVAAVTAEWLVRALRRWEARESAPARAPGDI